jgi:hypothetical protein
MRRAASLLLRRLCMELAGIIINPELRLTRPSRDDALRSLQRGMSIMPEIVDHILRSYAGELDSDFLEACREKVKRYIETLASTGKDSGQLTEYGLAYLKELHHPDPRYSGW